MESLKSKRQKSLVHSLQNGCDTFFKAVVRTACFVFIVFTYFASAIILNVVQWAVWCCFFVKRTKRERTCRWICARWWDYTSFFAYNFFAIKFVFYGKEIDKRKKSILIANHGLGVDFLASHGLIEALGIGVENVIGLLKRSLLLLPGVGTMNYFQGSLFISRKWTEDKNKIESELKSIFNNRFEPFCIGLFPEGTRKTPKKIIQSQEFARKRGLPIFKNVLIPRCKGLNLVVQCSRGNVDLLYDCTLAYDKYPIRIRDLIFGRNDYTPRCVHILIESYKLEEIPKTEESLKEWTIESFKRKEKRLEYFKMHKDFNEPVLKESQKKHFANFVFLTFSTMAVLYASGLVSLSFVKMWILMTIVTMGECGRSLLSDVQ